MPSRMSRVERLYTVVPRRRAWRGLGPKRIRDPHGTVRPTLGEVFSDDRRQVGDLGVGPKVGIEPAQLVGRGAAKRHPSDFLAGIEKQVPSQDP